MSTEQELSSDLVGRMKQVRQKAVSLQTCFREGAETMGYAVRCIDHAMPIVLKLGGEVVGSTGISTLAGNSAELAGSLNAQFDEIAACLPPTTQISSVLSTSRAVSVVAIAGSTYFDDVSPIGDVPATPLVQDDDVSHFAHKLEFVDREAAQMYRSSWQALDSGATDGHRQALVSMRQAFDRFIRTFAGDNAAVIDTLWGADSDGKKVTRKDRLSFIANEVVSDPRQSLVLVDLLDTTMQAYKDLNALHEDQLRLDQARAFVATADRTLRTWLPAVHPQLA